MTPWLISLSLLMVFINTSPSECFSGGSATGAAVEATAVFAGEAVAKEFVRSPDGNGEIVAFRFKVDRVWKGKVSEEVLLLTQQVKHANGLFSVPGEDFMPREGETYLVFAYGGQDGRLTTRSCSRSRSYDKAGQDLEELGIGYLPEKEEVKKTKNRLE